MASIPSWQTTMSAILALDAASKTVAFTMDSGSQRRLFVVFNNGGSYSPSNITYAGIPLNKIYSRTEIEIWSGKIPDNISGSQNLVVNSPGIPSPSWAYYIFSIKDAGNCAPDIVWGSGTILAAGGTTIGPISCPSSQSQLVIGVFTWGIAFGWTGTPTGITVRFTDPTNGTAGVYKVMGTANGNGGTTTFSFVPNIGSSDRTWVGGIFTVSLPTIEGDSVTPLAENGAIL